MAPSTLLAPGGPYAALRYRDFRLLMTGNFLSTLGEQMVSVAIGWELYNRTNSAFALGLVGLVQITPVILLSLFAGHIADRTDRKMMAQITQGVLVLGVLGLFALSAAGGSLALIYGCLTLIGVARAFHGPAASTMLPMTVPPDVFANAATWGSSAWQAAAVLGPALGGFTIAYFGSAAPVYLIDVVAGLLLMVMVALIHGRPLPPVPPPQETTLQSLAAGLRFVWHTRIILAVIALDLFAVLLGGATALLPVFARDILQVGAAGLGWLRAAPSVGAITTALLLAYLPPFKRSGLTLLWAVAGFGLATIIFGMSRSFALSLLMLALLGACDMISVVIRSTLLLLRTPDAMRGRVSAVNSIFVGSSNELGAFESGTLAALIGPIATVILGGLGTILVVVAAARIWPEIRALGPLQDEKPES